MNESTIVPMKDMLEAMEMVSLNPQQCEMYSPEWVREIVSYHQPDGDAIKRITNVREAIASVLTAVIENCSDCSDRDTALHLIRQGMFHANSSIVLDAMV